jgi:radical SAM PhpK family P-methyltransferase
LIGHNEGEFADEVEIIRSMGTDSGAWGDLNLSFVEIDGTPRHAMDVINLYNGRQAPGAKRLSNVDFFWPAIAYLTTYLTRRGFTVDYINRFREERALLEEKLRGHDVMAVAVTTTLYVGSWWIEEIVKAVRRCDSAVKIILGGPYIHNQAQVLTPIQLQALCQHLGADVYVISPEGEQALANVLAALKAGHPLGFVDNIVYRRSGRFVRTQTSPESSPLAENMVDYTLFPAERIGDCVTTRTAKSCPFACSFCGFPQRAGKYAYEGIEQVEKELDHIRDIGTVTTLTFIDDTFNVPMNRFKEILRLMIRKDYGFGWTSFLRSDHVDRECIDLMRQSGCESVFLGVESGSDKMLKLMNKTSRSEHYRKVIPQLKEAGIVTYCSLIIGFPGEDDDTVRETLDLLDSTQPDFYRAQLWYCDPTTPIWKRRDELGIKGAAFSWSHPSMDSVAAARVIDQIFLTERQSIWLPQHGFELWSVFYLQRQGMPLEQLKTFLRRFNEAVRLKLAGSQGGDDYREVMRAVAESCHLDPAPGSLARVVPQPVS